ncbi:helix-turn-helix domain-containing protein [Candidatus Clostridium stratigraminis]|uniref:Helix-turn-helix domain-containing protein n=1 Tax=Candidatus Clostridium stratigraminis TaxID=3381661 RepID=A0ABW8T9I6_9CLOT
MNLILNDKDYCTLMRRKYNIKLKTIADYIGCSISTLSRWERGLIETSDFIIKRYLQFIKEHLKNI